MRRAHRSQAKCRCLRCRPCRRTNSAHSHTHAQPPVNRLLNSPEDLAASPDFAGLRKALAAAVRARLGDLEVCFESLCEAGRPYVSAAAAVANRTWHLPHTNGRNHKPSQITLNDEELTSDLVSLPPPALARLLASSRLRVAGEASVVAAINAWVTARGGAEHVETEVSTASLLPQ